MKNKMIDILLYGNTDKESFYKVYPNITESAKKNLWVFSFVATCGMIGMYLASYIDASLVKNRPAYLICAFAFMAIALIISKCKSDSKHIIYICMYTFVGLLFAFGIALGTMVEPNQMTVSFPILLFAVPLLFTDIPIRMNASIIIGIIVYTFAAKYTQNDIMFGYNMSNIIPYGIISIVVSTYMMNIKIHKYVLEHQNKFLSEMDQLTGMLNRRCYEQKIQAIKEQGYTDSLLICAFDINGLKMVNDNIGHHAGDELIRGAASCIEGIFGVYGTCYRTGGDEFIAILEGAYPTNDELITSFENRCACFKGKYVSGLSVSVGMIKADNNKNIDTLIREADKDLYDNKSQYYQKAEHDRRQR